MKTKNMRKKALMSSVAMLLVAIVALSGATYAWFSANTDATVSPIYLRTERQSSLVLADDVIANADTATFTSSLSVNWLQTLQPVSGSVNTTTGAISFKKAIANSEAMTGNEDTTPVSGIQNGATTDYLQKTILVKSSVKSQVILKSVSGAGDLANALRIAVKIGTSTIVYAPGNDDGASDNDTTRSVNVVTGGPTSSITDVTYSDLYNATSAATAKSITFGTASIGTLGTTQIASDLTANTAAEMQITIWLEGNDKDCTNELAGKTIGTWANDFSSASGSGLQLTFTSVEVA